MIITIFFVFFWRDFCMSRRIVTNKKLHNDDTNDFQE